MMRDQLNNFLKHANNLMWLKDAFCQVDAHRLSDRAQLWPISIGYNRVSNHALILCEYDEMNDETGLEELCGYCLSSITLMNEEDSEFSYLVIDAGYDDAEVDIPIFVLDKDEALDVASKLGFEQVLKLR